MARRLRLTCAAAAALLAVSASAPRARQRDAGGDTGVVVEQLEAGGVAEAAGLRRGDHLVSWETPCPLPGTAPASGTIASTFDFWSAVWGEAPRCPLRLRGWRGGAAISFTMPEHERDLHVRPALSGAPLALYEKGDWRGLAEALSAAGRRRDASWAWGRHANAELKARHPAQAQEAFAAARALARSARDPDALAQVWLREALLRHERNEMEKAAAAYAEALRATDASAPDGLLAARILRNAANLALLRGYSEQARPWLERSAAILTRLAPRSVGLARTLELQAWVLEDKGQLDAAEGLLERAALLAEHSGMPGRRTLSQAMNLLGNLASMRGDLPAADRYHERQLRIVESLSAEGEAAGIALMGRASVANARGDLDAAERHARAALALFEKRSPSGVQMARCLEYLALIARDRGDYEAALDWLRRSLELFEALGPDSLEVARALDFTGDIHRLAGHAAQGEPFVRRALEIMRQHAPQGGDAAYCLRDLAALSRARGDRDGAERLLKEALAVHRRADRLGAAMDLAELGQLAFERRELSRAEALQREALAIRLKIEPGSAELAESWHALALVLRSAGRLREAAAGLEQALVALESQQGKLGGAEDVRSSFAAGYADYYRDAVGLLVEQGRAREAFHVLERARARSLLALLAERDLTFAEMPPELERERRQVNADYDRTQGEIAAAPPESAALERGLAHLRELRDRRARVEAQLRQASPHLASLRYPSPLDLEGARSALDPGTVLLSYCVAQEKTFLFVVSAGPHAAADGLAVRVLPVGGEALRNRVVSLRGLLESAGRSPADVEDWRAQAASLYDDLVRPAEDAIAPARRVLISPDGPLHVLPFPALVAARTPLRYWIESKPLHTTLSATLYAELRRTRLSAAPAAAATLTAFGDPVLHPAPGAPPPRPGDNVALRAGRLGPLPWSRDEVQRIAGTFAPEARAYVGAEATEERAKALGRAPRYVHFATHGVLDRRFPLNSALVLAQPSAGATGGENGLLQAWEIFESVRLDAELVTLSACETGLGREAGGEGLMSLSRAFHYAGARSVLASLWSVSDRSTPELMVRFYAGLKHGLSKDEALQAAQVAMIHTPGASHPFHWAAFQLSGDWK
jgi:CHAT domain-containing protein